MSHSESPAVAEHHRQAPRSVMCAVVTVSDTRTLENDHSGAALIELLEAAGHRIATRALVPDEKASLELAVLDLVVSPAVQAVLLTGGTGIAPRDQTPDTLARLFTKELTGFGELFRMLSYQEVGAAAMLSRASAGLIQQTVVILMPGSTAAVRLAMERLVLPELGHMVQLAAKTV
jgi:molybdenum cofactor biosynthesis protein B